MSTTHQLVVRSGDADLFVHTAGGGPDSEVLAVLSGGPGLSHEYLTGLFGLASPNLHVVLYDPRGVGRSTGRIDGDLLVDQAHDLAAILATLGADRAHLLGHSFGGLTIALVAEHAPDLIASAIFVDSAPTTRAALDIALAVLHEHIGQLIESGAITPDDSADPTAWIRSVLPAYFHDPNHPHAHAHGGVTYSAPVSTALLDRFGAYDTTAALTSVTAPSLVIGCTTPFGSMGTSVADALPPDTTQTVVLNECGHLPWLETPEQFSPLVHDFLTVHTAGSADRR